MALTVDLLGSLPQSRRCGREGQRSIREDIGGSRVKGYFGTQNFLTIDLRCQRQPVLLWINTTSLSP